MLEFVTKATESRRYVCFERFSRDLVKRPVAQALQALQRRLLHSTCGGMAQPSGRLCHPTGLAASRCPAAS